MNKYNLLLAIYCLLLSQISFGEVPEELKLADLSVKITIANLTTIRPEFKKIQNSIENLNSSSNSCPSSLLAEIKRLNANRGLSDSVHFYLGVCKDLEGSTKEAIEEYETSINLKRSNKEALLRLAYLNAVDKNFQRSQTLAEEVLWLGYKPKDVPIYLVAVAQKHLNNTKEALVSLDKLEASNPKFAPSLILRKNIILEDIKKAPDPNKQKLLVDSYNRLLPRLISLDPENKTYTMEYARILLSQGHPLHNPYALNQGLSMTRKFSRQGGKIEEAFLLLELQFLEKQGKTGEALDILNKASANTPLSPNLEFRKQEIFDKLNPKSEEE